MRMKSSLQQFGDLPKRLALREALSLSLCPPIPSTPTPYRTTMVHYRSTRGGMRDLSFEQAVLTGLASDRGLLVPEDGQFPRLPENALRDWAKLSYQELAVRVMRLFIDEKEISTEELTALVHKSYNAQTFRAEETTPVVKITDQLLVLELFHGPTFAFKDVALQFLGNLFEFFLKRKNAAKAENAPTHKITVVGATSGDTGSSAIYGLRGKENIEVFITFPHGRVSQIQERQMTTVLDDNIHNVAVEVRRIDRVASFLLVCADWRLTLISFCLGHV